MTLTKRSDGRKFDELRPMEAKVGVIKRANGSAMFKIGNTQAIAAVYGPRELYPGHLQNPEKGLLRCNYNMIAFSGAGDRVKPGPSRRSREISMVTENALNSIVDLNQYSNAVVDVFIELVNTDAGTRCAGICAAAMALADAGIPMRDMICAVSVGKVEDKIVVDLNYDEDSAEKGVDFPVAITARTGKVTLLQMDGLLKKDEIKDLLRAAKKAAEQINKVQVKAIREKYEK
ncbi:MAG: exosome complex exonuclease Rrp41 [Nanoarchaeota archaeon]|nr:exosome complex exonuclease Rrp41 [Nanoarchaeota archaeon]MBU0962392.1 exosome complex exonuclease Rrp41 [Nanoarchaeota archaeon]